MITTGQPDRGCYGMKQKTDQQKLLKALRKLRKRNRELLRTGKVKVQQPEHGQFTDICTNLVQKAALLTPHRNPVKLAMSNI
jgi:hypothetical protein